MNQDLANYVREASFHLTLSQQMIVCLMEVERDCRDTKQGYGIVYNRSAQNALYRRGLIIPTGKEIPNAWRESVNWPYCFELTKAGELIVALLHEAGFEPPPPLPSYEPTNEFVPEVTVTRKEQQRKNKMADAPPETAREDNARAYMQALGVVIDDALPEKWGFVLITFPFADEPGRMNYIANGKRDDIIRLLVEFLDKFKQHGFSHPTEAFNDTDRLGWISKQLLAISMKSVNGQTNMLEWLGLKDARSFREEIDKRMTDETKNRNPDKTKVG